MTLLTAAEVAARWRVSPRLIRKLVALGELRAVRTGDRLLRFREADLEDYAARHLEGGTDGEAAVRLGDGLEKGGRQVGGDVGAAAGERPATARAPRQIHRGRSVEGDGVR